MAELRARAVSSCGAPADAWPETFADLVADASGRARKVLKQLPLIREMHRLLESAIAQSERVVQLADSLSHTLRAVKRAVVHLCVLCAGTTYHQKLRRRAARELDEREVT